MDSLFNYLDGTVAILASVGVALALGLVFTFLVSLKLRATKGFFVTSVLMPVLVAAVIAVMEVVLSGISNGATELGRIATIAVALGLIRFRSMNAKAEELLVLFGGTTIGFVCGLGYVVIAAIIAVVVAVLYLGLSSTRLFDGKRFGAEKLLKVTIPESLEYSEVFNQTFEHYLKKAELVEVKTTGMGSLFRLSYRIEFKNIKEEKEFIDEIRTKNGNLEISVLPYTGEDKSL